MKAATDTKNKGDKLWLREKYNQQYLGAVCVSISNSKYCSWLH